MISKYQKNNQSFSQIIRLFVHNKIIYEITIKKKKQFIMVLIIR